jgi:uncharacterized protein
VRKRLRKKLHQGEFQEMGFEVQCRVAADMSETAFDAFVDAFLEQAIEANGLMFGGGGRREWKGFVTLERRGSATDDHRQVMQRWLESQLQIVEYQVGPLVDAWYPASHARQQAHRKPGAADVSDVIGQDHRWG